MSAADEAGAREASEGIRSDGFGGRKCVWEWRATEEEGSNPDGFGGGRRRGFGAGAGRRRAACV